MAVIIEIMGNLIITFLYLFGLVILFVYIYSLLGMEIFGGKLDYDCVSRQNFDDFLAALNSSFQIMTIEQWETIYFGIVKGKTVPAWIVNGYFFSWMVIGKYVLLNLFIAMVLDGFSNQTVEQQIEEIESAQFDEDAVEREIYN